MDETRRNIRRNRRFLLKLKNLNKKSTASQKVLLKTQLLKLTPCSTLTTNPRGILLEIKPSSPSSRKKKTVLSYGDNNKGKILVLG